MSYESSGIVGCLTELEIRVGVEALLETSGWGGRLSSREVRRASLLKEVAKLIAGLENKKQIKQRLICRVMRDNVDWAISRYFEYEAIPFDYLKIVRSGDCIETLIKGIFYKVCKIRRSDLLDIEVSELCEALKKNNSLSIVYDRVGIIQKFVHGKVDKFCGEGAHDLLPVKHMRNLLSVARLHLNISDIQSKDENYAVYMDSLSKLASDFEYFHPSNPTLLPGKRIIPKWRVRHLKPLSHFYRINACETIAELQGLSEKLPLEVFATKAFEIYADSK